MYGLKYKKLESIIDFYETGWQSQRICLKLRHFCPCFALYEKFFKKNVSFQYLQDIALSYISIEYTLIT